MDLKTSLQKLEQFRELYEAMRAGKDLWKDVVELYGQIEELVIRLDGNQKIQLDGGDGITNTYSTYIESALYSGSRAHYTSARGQIHKLVGRVRGLLEHPESLETPATVAQLLRVLQRFRECCQYIEAPPSSERHVQDTLWIMLRSHFDYLEREDTLPKFGEKNYRPDFGVPEVGALVEVKFIGDKTDTGKIQDEVLADVPAYLSVATKYSSVAFLVYDAAHKLRDPSRFIRAIKQLGGVLDVIVVPGIA